MTVVLELALLAVLMGLSAFFSSSETALFSLNQVQLEQMRRDGDSKIDLIERLLSQPRHLIVTILIGNEFVNVAASAISAALVIQLLGAENKWINLLIMIPLLLLVGEITPKTLAIRNNQAFARTQCRFIDLFAKAITPLRITVRRIADLFITLIVGAERSRANILTEDMVRSLTHEAVGQGVLDSEEALYIHRIFEFSAKSLHDIMMPRSQIFFLSDRTSLEDAAKAYRRTGHTKIPVFKGSKDSVIGVIYVRDLLRAELGDRTAPADRGTIAPFLREAYFVPETKSVADLFYAFRKRKLSLALTVDEYGGVTGLVTMEDLLECIFGEFMSRSERLLLRQSKFRELEGNKWLVDGTTTVDRLNRVLRTSFATESAETVGGLLLEAFGELPAKGREIVIDGYEFSILSVQGRRIAEISIEPAVSRDGQNEVPAEIVKSQGTEVGAAERAAPARPDNRDDQAGASG